MSLLCAIVTGDCGNLSGPWALWLASCYWYLHTASWMWVKSTSVEVLWCMGKSCGQYHHKSSVETDETHLCWGRTCRHCVRAKICRMEVSLLHIVC